MKPFVVLIACLLFAGCELLTPITGTPGREAAADQPDEVVWVVQNVVGGKQCVTQSFDPPDLEAVLKNGGVTVVREVIQPMPTCAACEICPLYAAQHFYEIDAADLAAAEALGFDEHDPPAGIE